MENEVLKELTRQEEEVLRLIDPVLKQRLDAIRVVRESYLNVLGGGSSNSSGTVPKGASITGAVGHGRGKVAEPLPEEYSTTLTKKNKIYYALKVIKQPATSDQVKASLLTLDATFLNEEDLDKTVRDNLYHLSKAKHVVIMKKGGRNTYKTREK